MTTAKSTIVKDRVTVGTMASGRNVSVPYMIHCGAADGPCLWINAAVHGDEINGVIAAIEFFKYLEALSIAGCVIVTPVANVLALEERRKTTLHDGLDMDQTFPGRPDGFATERVAHALFRDFGTTADVIVNLHTLGTAYDAEPYAVYKQHVDHDENDLLKRISCFEPTVACRMPVNDAPGELRGNIAGALDYQGLLSGAQAFMIELGAGGRLERPAISSGVDGLIRLASDLGILKGRDVDTGERAIKLVKVTAREHVLAHAGGFYDAQARPGTVLPAGEPFGVTRDVFGDVVDQRCLDEPCWVIANRRDPVVHTGDRMAFVATAWEDVEIVG
ncbi:MAG: succinylglutamate desuccinylase/aspartoacylase family protein [Pseudomonadota bacterium]